MKSSNKVISGDTIKETHPFEGSELEATFKVENFPFESDRLGANIDESKLVTENAKYHMETVVLEKIPKAEADILGVEPPSSSSIETNDDLLHNNETYSDSDSNFDPDSERDPFADIDCDPSFLKIPESDILIDSTSTASAQSINPIDVNDDGLDLSSLPSATASKHIRVHKKMEYTLQCQLCLQTQPSKIKLKSHIEICAASHKNLRRFCKHCNFLFRYPHGYRRHAASSHGVNSADGSDTSKLPSSPTVTILGSFLQCQLCMETLSTESKLKTHLEICASSHKNRRRFCIPCNRLFAQPTRYRKHASGIHRISKEALPTGYPFKCQFCPNCFALEESLIAHTASKHENSTASDHNLKLKPFPCSECSSRFKQRSALKSHMMMHTDEKLFKCSVPGCDKAFKLNGILKDHLIRAHSEEKPFKCQELNCEKTFKFNYQLRRHMDCHSEERPFKCPYSGCGGTFKNKDKVTKHLAVHTGARRYRHVTERPFKCGQCDRAFCKKYQLTVHVKLVHANEIFPCPEPNCATKCKYKNSLKIHLATIHSR